MTKNSLSRPRLLALGVVVALMPTLALAYIDPGNGAYAVQLLFTFVGVALFYLRHPIRAVKAAWHSISRRFRQDGAGQ